MQYLFDDEGRPYLDAFGGFATVCCGHSHPVVVNPIVNQAKILQHSTVLNLHHATADFAQALASKLPGNLKFVVFFINSGTEGNELALMMARLYTGCQEVISLRNAHHGNAAGTMGVTAEIDYFSGWSSHALNPDQCRGVFGSDGPKYAKDVEELVAYDEVQSGFDQTRSRFWGFEDHRVVPDIVTMAKGRGNGIPIGSVVTTPEIARVLVHRNHSSYLTTFGGNPLSTSAALANLIVMEKENLQQNGLTIGSYQKERLASLEDKHESVYSLCPKIIVQFEISLLVQFELEMKTHTGQ
ncbi:OLC1v1006396C1 [Oldenlandia corymbosa var. corymbosa]|uniref:OLC1v1006396C1 n=1 Tax=Oldenlandia corymbosa var. corymbosa TaxID=529605 RepID=A0AAV1DHE2_OLDCO|nr:OLC1v1006396C1 [Oldenlandia corymbosa var. corymbosa]